MLSTVLNATLSLAEKATAKLRKEVMAEAVKSQMRWEDLLVHSANVVIGSYNCLCGAINAFRFRDSEIGTVRCVRCNTLHSVKEHEIDSPSILFDSLVSAYKHGWSKIFKKGGE